MFPDFFRDDVFRLETQRLWLRWPTAADGAAIERLAGERDVAAPTARIPHPYPAGGGEAFALFARQANLSGEALHLAIALKQKPGAAIGMVSLESGGEGPTLGYWLGTRYWGAGLMSEAVSGLLDMIWLTTDVERIEADVALVNPRSRRVLEKAGFVALGETLAGAPARGAPMPAMRFALQRPRARFGATPAQGARALSACRAAM